MLTVTELSISEQYTSNFQIKRLKLCNYLILSFQQAGVLFVVQLFDVDLRVVLQLQQLGRLHRRLEDGGEVGQGEFADGVAVQRAVLDATHPGNVAARTSHVNLKNAILKCLSGNSKLSQQRGLLTLHTKVFF